jgi:hypothetical protein
LLTQMRAINNTARSIDNLFPGMKDQFKMARGNNDQATLNRARAYITEATPIQARFTDRGLPATFLDDLQAAIDAVGEADDHQSAALAAQTAATAGVAAALKQLRDALRELHRTQHLPQRPGHARRLQEREPRRKRPEEGQEERAPAQLSYDHRGNGLTFT